jgi:cytochrome P450
METTTMNAKGAVDWDPYNPIHFKDPYPVFRQLREDCPIYFNEQYNFYAVSRYDDVQRLLGDRDSFVSRHGDLLEFITGKLEFPSGMFIYEDPPLHTVHRALLTRIFTPKKMTELEPQIRAYCAKALDPVVDDGVFDFIGDLGAEMPIRVIGMLLGIPEQDLKKVQNFVDDSLGVEPGKPMEVESSHFNFSGTVFEDYIDWRAKHPSDDLMTALLNVEFVDETGATRKLTRGEILIFVNILAGAGNETTNRLIGWTAKTLAEHPDQRRQIHQDRRLIPQTIEEVLRFEPPGPATGRYVEREAEFHGVKVPKGSAVLGLVGAANRDERKFTNGEAFDIHRETVPHLTFGYGFHACLGNALARIEGRVALDEILTRFPEWEVDLEAARLSCTSSVRGWETLPAYTPKAKGRARRRPAPEATPAAVPTPEGAEAWSLVLQTPMGPQEMTAHLVRDGASLTGLIVTQAGSEPILQGRCQGGTLDWKLEVKTPMPLTMSFQVEIEADALAGEVTLGAFGKAKVAGERARA